MIGLYFHIPFCKKACTYCDFHFSTQLQKREEMVQAMILEWKSILPEIQNQPIPTLYFGGGTPSLLKPEQLQQIVDELKSDQALEHLVEFTLEVNPDDINRAQLAFWKSIGVNRLSIGVQSFDDGVLQWMNRAHNANDALQAIQLCQDAGIDNLNLDIIYGHRQYSRLDLEKDLSQFLQLQPKHISAYALTVEPQTALSHQVQQLRYMPPEQEDVLEDYLKIHQMLTQSGMSHYELSNYAMPGFESKHNTQYWRGQAYWGIGPSAHSFDGKTKRSWNMANNALYTRRFLQNDTAILIKTEEFLTPIQQANEHWMTRLRTREGLSLHDFTEKWSLSFSAKQKDKMEQWRHSGHLKFDGNTITCTPEGWLVLDAILSDVFFN